MVLGGRKRDSVVAEGQGQGFLWLKYRILVCKIFYHNVYFTLLLGRWYLKQSFLVWTLTKPPYVVLSRGCYFKMVLCLGELGTTDYHSVYILVSDSFAYRSPLKTSLHELKGKKFQEKVVFFFDTELGAKRNIRILTSRFVVCLRNQLNGFDHELTHRNHWMKAGIPVWFLPMKCGEFFLCYSPTIQNLDLGKVFLEL